MTNLPRNWTRTPLGNACAILDFKRIPINSKERQTRISGKPDSELFPYYGATGQVDVIDGYLFEGEHVLLGEDGAPFFDPFRDKAYVVDGKFWVNNHAHILKAYGSNRYLSHYLNAVRYEDHVTGTTRPKLTKGALVSIPVALPPLNEQHRIVERIESLFDEIHRGLESLHEAKRTIGLYRQSLLKSAFEGRLTAHWRAENSDRLESPEGLLARIREERQDCYRSALDDWRLALGRWHAKGGKGVKPAKPKKPTNVPALDDREMKKLPPVPDAWGFNRMGLYIAWIQAGKSFKCLESEPAMDQVGVAKVSAVTWGEYDEAESKTCLNEDNVNEELFIREGDFLLSRANTIELVGAAVIVKRATKKIMLSDKTLRIHFAARDRRFFLHYLRSPYGRAEIQARSTGNQASMRNIGQDRINSIILPICSPAEQVEIVRILDERLEAVDTLQAEIDINLARADALQQSILKKAISGQLIPQDRTDEPASALLARIRAERDTEPTKRARRRAEA